MQDPLLQHILDYVEMAQRAARFEKQADVDCVVAPVITQGVAPQEYDEITCAGCGQKGRVAPGVVKPSTKALCPSCARAVHLGE